MPGNNIDFFTFEFLNHTLNPVPLNADTCADRINVRIAGTNCYFTAASGFSGCPDNVDNAFVDFRDFCFKQADQKSGMCSRKDNLWSPAFFKYLNDIGSDSVAPSVIFTGNLFSFRNHRFCLAQVDNNFIPGRPLNNPVNDFTLAFDKTVIYRISFSDFEFLYDYLFGGLGGNSAEGRGIHFGTEEVTDLTFRVQFPSLFHVDLKSRFSDFFDYLFELEYLKFTGFIVVLNFNVDFVTEFFFGG